MKHLGLRGIGLLLFLLSIVGLMATITLSISGGVKDYTNFNMIVDRQIKDYLGVFRLSGFAVGTIFIQLMIFAVSSIETFVKSKFNRHYKKVVVLQYGLLIVSIYYNFKFFGFDNPIKLLLCILLDLGIIKLVSLAVDLMTLNYSLADDKKEMSILNLAMYNLTAKFKYRLLSEYNKNKNMLCTESKSENIENTGIKKSQNKSEDIIKYIENIKEGEKIPVTKILKTFGLTKRQWEKIRDHNDLLTVKNGFTYRKEILINE